MIEIVEEVEEFLVSVMRVIACVHSEKEAGAHRFEERVAVIPVKFVVEKLVGEPARRVGQRRDVRDQLGE